jgi:hypothetical protein
MPDRPRNAVVPAFLGRVVSRRALIRRAALATGALVAARTAHSHTSPGFSTPSVSAAGWPDWLFIGQVVGIELPDRAYLDRSIAETEEVVTVVLTPDATVGRRLEPGLHVFNIGEEIAAEGRWHNDVFEASYFANLFRHAEGDVEAIDVIGETLHVDGTQYRLPAEAIIRDSTGMLAVEPALEDRMLGSRIGMNYRNDPVGGVPVAAMIGLPESSR